MPTYSFENIETGEQFELIMSYDDKLNYLKENQMIKSIMTSAPSMVSGVNHNSKMDSGWKENLSRIAEAHPNSALAGKVGGRSAKVAKTNEVLKKHKVNKGSYKMKNL